MAQQVVSLSDNAIVKVNELIHMKEKKPLGLKISLKTRGCSGLSWNLDFVYEENKFDEAIDYGNFKVFIDPKAILFILGSVVDYEQNELEEGFIFSNPKEKGRCGCGESFKI